MSGGVAASAEGVEGARVELHGDRIVIERGGLFASLRQGQRVEIPLEDVAGALVTSPAWGLRGVFVVVAPGEAPNGGFASNNTNPRAVYFERDQQPAFERLRAEILARVSVPPATAPSAAGAAPAAGRGAPVAGWAEREPTVLVLTARPRVQGISDLDVDLEERVILESLQRGPAARMVDLEQRPAVSVDTLLNDTLSTLPTVLHFSGHGIVSGLIMETPGRGAALVSEAALIRLCGIPEVARRLRMLVLNACLTADQAKALARTVPAVVGTLENVADGAAVAFSRGFYTALGHGTSVASAFAAGVAQVSIAAGEQEAQKYALFRRGDIDPSTWGLIDAG